MSAECQRNLKLMKAKLSILFLVGCVTGASVGFAQTNSPAPDSAGTAPASPATTEAASPAPAASTAQPATTVAAADATAKEPAAGAESTAAPAAPAADPTNAPVASAESTNAPVSAAAETTNAPAAAADTNAAPAGDTASVDPSAVIPLIVMDDVPLTDAIRNLARQARLNYMLDPKIGYGQPGPDGKPVLAQPTVSIRWENVTAQQALMALLSNYNLELVDDPKTHIARVTVKDPAAPPPLETKIYQLQYASPSNIVNSVRAALSDKRSKVMPDVRTSQLVVVATDKELADVDELTKRLDTQTKQVLIEARMIETSINPSTIKGVDWTGTLQGQHMAVGNNLQYKPVSQADSANQPLSTLWPKMMLDTARGFNPATAFLDADGVNMVLSFLNQNSEAKVLSAPRTVMLDNETATLSVTRATPIINVTPGTVQTTGGSQITYTNLGVTLLVTPRISANNFVNLHIQPEVSRKFDTVRRIVAGGEYDADEYDLRSIDTHVMIPSGNTLVLGGLAQDDVEEINTKVPVLGDIPVLGYLFRSDAKNRKKTNLLIFITPTIVRDEDFQPTKTDFLKTPPPAKDEIEPDWSAWDSGKPKDWSKKKKDDQATSTAGDGANDARFAPVP